MTIGKSGYGTWVIAAALSQSLAWASVDESSKYLCSASCVTFVNLGTLEETGATRQEAFHRLKEACQNYQVDGYTRKLQVLAEVSCATQVKEHWVPATPFNACDLN